MRNVIHAVIAAAAALIATAACTVNHTSVPTAASPSEQSVTVRMSATPSTVPMDGTTRATVAMQAFDALGKPAAGLVLSVTLDPGFGTVSPASVTTGADGKATAVYTPPLSTGSATIEKVQASPATADIRTPASVVAINLLNIVPQPPVVVTPNSPPPSPDFVFSPGTPTVNQTIFFNANASKAATGRFIASFKWDFGDGTVDTTSGSMPSHKWAVAGDYNVTLTITDDVGATASKTQKITVASGAPKANIAIVTAAPYIHNQPITFNASGSTAIVGATIVDYTWTMVDANGTVSTIDQHTSPTINFTFTTIGTATVQLTVTDDSGRSGTASQTLSIQ